jgi:rRNA maturation endonuclease Nob1
MKQKIYRRCLNCGKEWKLRKVDSKLCPLCHSTDGETIPEFMHLRDKLKRTKPNKYPYRRNWGKPEKSKL